MSISHGRGGEHVRQEWEVKFCLDWYLLFEYCHTLERSQPGSSFHWLSVSKSLLVIFCGLDHSLFADLDPVVIVWVAKPSFPLAHPSDGIPENAGSGCSDQETKDSIDI